MKVRAVQEIMEQWAPRQLAWERDNAGLQCGDPEDSVRGVLVSLDVTSELVQEAVRRRVNLIVSHHPLLFRPLRSVTPQDDAGRCIRALVRTGISVYAAHTNLDFAPGGTSFALAGVLGLMETEFLRKPREMMKKIVTFVPAPDAERVAAALGDAGAGIIGKYDHCSFRTEGQGTFRGNAQSRPAVGRREQLEHVREIRLEMVVAAWRLDRDVKALLASHPYEEVAYDVVPLENWSGEYGMGVIGSLNEAVPLAVFLARAKRRLGAGTLRWTGNPRRSIRRVAVCGGSGSELLGEAIRQHADVFVTADIKYHSFHDAAGAIALVDAGHYETEYPVVPAIVNRLRSEFRRAGDRVAVHAAQRSTNPVRYD